MIYKQVQIDKFFMKADDAIKVVVIYGSNDGLVAEYVKKFAQVVVPDLNDAFQVANLLWDNVSGDFGVVAGEYGAQSLMGGRRVVVIREASNPLTKVLRELFDSSTSDTLLIATSSNLKTKDSLAVMAKDENFMYGIGCYDDRDEDISQFASKFMSRNNFNIDNSAFQMLCSRLSNDRKISQNELEKLITYMGNKRDITINDIKTVISDTSASSQEDLCYFIALGDTQKAINSYNRLIFEGENPVSIVRTIEYHFMKLLDCAIKIEKGDTADKVVSGIRPPLMFFRKNSFISQLRIWNRIRILSALTLLYQTERECKTTDLPAEQVASFTILRIANGVKRFR